MTEFRLSQKYMSRFRRRALSTALPLALIAGAAGIWISTAQSKSTTGLFVVTPFGLLCLGIGFAQAWRRQTQLADSFRIRITDDQITREMLGVPPLSIARSDVRRIERDPSGALTIHTTTTNTSLALPPEVEEYATLMAHLEGWRPIEAGAPAHSQIKAIAIALLVIAMFVVAMVAKQRVLATRPVLRASES
jgi:hypothetical protein